MLEKLKQKWNIESNFQIIVIFFVFAITGSSSLYVSRFVLDLIGITEDSAIWLKVLGYLIIVFPIYQILLTIFGILFGQGKFFIGFQKKIISRFKRKKQT